MHDDLVLFSDRLNQLKADPDAAAFITKGPYQLLFCILFDDKEKPRAIQLTLSTFTKNLFSIECPISTSPRKLLKDFLQKAQDNPKVGLHWTMPGGDS